MKNDRGHTPGPSASTSLDDRTLRATAARRSWLCPGAGLALVGRGELATATYLTSLGVLVAMAWVALQPGAAALWTTLSVMAIALALWIGEHVAVRRLKPQPPKPSFLVAGFAVSSAVGWLGTLAFVVLVATLRQPTATTPTATGR